MSGFINSSPYLRTSRAFPVEPNALVQEISKSYIDTASAVNLRVIALFPTSRAAITGEQWFLKNNFPTQSVRQIYIFAAIASGATLNIPHNINNILDFTRIFGTCITSTPDYRPIPFSSTVANANISVTVTTTNIIIAVGSASPNIVSGKIVLEWFP